MPTDQLIGAADALRKARAILSTAGAQVIEHSAAAMASVLATLESVPDPAFAAHSTQIARHTASTHATVLHAVKDGTYALSRRLNRLKAALGAAGVHDPAWAPVAAAIGSNADRDSPVRPGRDATVEEIHEWWAGIDDDYRGLMIRDHADDLRHVDGIPIPVRDDLNQRQLQVDIAQLESELAIIQDTIAELRADLLATFDPADWQAGVRGVQQTIRDLEMRKNELVGTLRGLIDVRGEIVRAEAQGREVFLIDYSLEGNGTLTFAYNNPDTTDRVVTYLPGGGTSLAKAARPLEAISNVLEMVERLDAGTQPPPTTSGIVRLYNIRTPIALHVLLSGVAKEAAPPLARFQHSLTVTRAAADADLEEPTDPRLVVIGLSYGNTVAGETAGQYGLAADAWASNGADGVRLPNASAADIPEVYATLMRNDALRLVHKATIPQGLQPTEKKFDAIPYASGTGPSGRLPGGASLRAHFGYLQDALVLVNLAEIVRGFPPIHTEPLDLAA